MVSVTKGSAPDNIGALVAEAVEALGYFRSDCIGKLTKLYIELWPQGTSKHMLDKGDFKALLSEKGLASPGQASMNTTLRITANAHREKFARGEPQWGPMFPRLQFSCPPKENCAGARILSDQIFRRETRPSLPLEHCDREWCGCNWLFVPDD